ncbi:MAG: hypothetical protein KatS3mg104_0308 [Phycisphaerae bacterium]|nr:MAG: hypothetical protein KatS3mg104_0308 [Phycisphaerae bacterium]
MSDSVQPPELDSSVTLDAFLSAASARQPIPGGGAVTALTGALASAIGEMVLNYSIQKKDLQQYHEHNTKALQELHNARRLFQQLMVEDQQAYLAFSQARKKAQADPQTLQQRVSDVYTSPSDHRDYCTAGACGSRSGSRTPAIAGCLATWPSVVNWPWQHSAVVFTMSGLICLNFPNPSKPNTSEECQRLHLQAIDAVKQLFFSPLTHAR